MSHQKMRENIQTASRSNNFRLTDNLKELLNVASLVAYLDKKKRVSLKHLLLAFIYKESSLQKLIVSKIQGDPKTVQYLDEKLLKNIEDYIKQHKGINNKVLEQVSLSRDVKNVLDLAIRFAIKSNSFYVGSEHAFAGLLVYLHDAKPKAFPALVKNFEPLKDFIIELIESHKKVFSVVENFVTDAKKPISPAISAGDQYSPPEHNFLQKYTINLASYIKLHFQDSNLVESRGSLTKKVLVTLHTSTTNSALIVGQSGVGKTFLVYDLAQKIDRGELNLDGKYKEVRILNIPELLATIKFATDIEKRFLGVLNELFDKKDTILFLDDLHVLIAPVARGGYNLGNALKDFLRSNKISILATIDKDVFDAMKAYYKDLFDLFATIEITEPKEHVIYRILKKHFQVYSSRVPILAQVDISKYLPAIKSIVKLSKEYILDGVLPSKAVHVLEGVLAQKLQAMIDELSMINTLSNKYEKLEDKVQYSIDVGDFKKAEALEKEISKIEKQEQLALAKAGKQTIVTIQDVYDYVAKKTKLPINMLDKAELGALQELEKALGKYIISQNHAVESVAYAVKRGRLGLVNKDKPWASLLFLGPTGVGKTGLAKALAKVLFGDDTEHFVQLDMSEFMEKHSISKLIGSPPGYVGYEEGGYLTERIKETPFAVVLFDEIEKASPDVLNILLQILEDGHLTDSHGETVSFKHTIIILTSNIGADKIFKEKVHGFMNEDDTINWQNYSSIKEKLLKQLKKHLRPELINRLDEVIVFNALGAAQVNKILDNIIAELNSRLEKFGVKVKLGIAAKNFLIRVGYSPEYGVRSLKRVVLNHVENVIADYVLTKGVNIYEQHKHIKDLQLEYNKKTGKLEVIS